MASSPPDSPSDLSVFMAAQQLLELSAGWKQNTPHHMTAAGDGVKPEPTRDKEVKSEPEDKLDSPHALNGFTKLYCHPLKNNKNRVGLVNGSEYANSTTVLCSVDEEEEEGEVKDALSRVKGIHLPVDGDGSLSVSPPPLVEDTCVPEGEEEEAEDMDTGEQEGMHNKGV